MNPCRLCPELDDAHASWCEPTHVGVPPADVTDRRWPRVRRDTLRGTASSAGPSASRSWRSPPARSSRRSRSCSESPRRRSGCSGWRTGYGSDCSRDSSATRSCLLRASDRCGIVAPMALHHGSSEDRIRDTDANPFVGEANPAFGSRVTPPRQRLANDPVPSEVAYQLIHDELLLGSARLNLATFVTTCGLHRGWPRVRISRDHRILAVRRNSASRHARRVGREARARPQQRGLGAGRSGRGGQGCRRVARAAPAQSGAA